MLFAVEVEVAKDLTDYVAVVATVFAALGTVGAVIWAMFGPDIRSKRMRPLLELSADHDSDFAYVDPSVPEVRDGVYLRLTNAKGRSTAEQVEVFFTALAEHPGLGDGPDGVLVIPSPADRRLNFDGTDGHLGTAVSTVPPGVSRRVYLARLGNPHKLFESWLPSPDAEKPKAIDKMCGAWATVPARRDQISWLVIGDERVIELTVAGANFDAIRYRGRIKITQTDHDHLEAAGIPISREVKLLWLENLRKVS